MLQVGVICPKCAKPFMAHVASSTPLDALDIPQCIDCFAKRIYAPPDVKAWIVSRLKAFPYEIIP